jgi:hypothetical protein
MNELLPIAGGLLLGTIIARVRPSWRLPLAVFGVIVIGFAATVLSGEFRISWGFLAIDIPGTGVAAACGYVLARRLRTRRAVRH